LPTLGSPLGAPVTSKCHADWDLILNTRAVKNNAKVDETRFITQKVRLFVKKQFLLQN